MIKTWQERAGTFPNTYLGPAAASANANEIREEIDELRSTVQELHRRWREAQIEIETLKHPHDKRKLTNLVYLSCFRVPPVWTPLKGIVADCTPRYLTKRVKELEELGWVMCSPGGRGTPGMYALTPLGQQALATLLQAADASADTPGRP